MKYSQKAGGFAALFEAAAYVFGMVFFLILVDSSGAVQPAQKVALLVDNLLSTQAMILFDYVVFGVALVVLVLALHDRLQAGSPAIMQTATAFGLIWACLLIASGMVFISGSAAVAALYSSDPSQAAAIWFTIDTVHAGLGGEGEILGGLWTLLISLAALRTGALPKALNYIGVVVGVAGILSIVPGLSVLVGIFVLGQIAWFVWIGILMLRHNPNVVVRQLEVEIPTTAQRQTNAAATS